uniref:Uncharacterized protein n=1 Tax=Macaca fascicularis TaxID=9541 RepID=A0A2K5UL45_MACFA
MRRPLLAPMGSRWNSGDGPEGAREQLWAALPPCDERRCSPFPPGGAGAGDRRVPGPVRRRGERQRGDRAAHRALPGHADHHQLVPGQHGSVRPTHPARVALRPVPPLALAALGVRAAALPPVALRGRGLHLRHAAAHDGAQRRALPGHLSPLRARVLVTRRRVRALIAVLWAVALLSAGPFLFLVGVEQDPDISVVPGLNGTARLAPSPPASSPPLWLSRAPPPSPPSGPETAEAAALFSRECRPSPAQLGALRVMLWVTTAYFFLPFLCLSILYGLIGRELWSSRRPLRGPATSGRERGHRQTVRVLAGGGSGIRSLLVAIPRWQNHLHKHRRSADDVLLSVL